MPSRIVLAALLTMLAVLATAGLHAQEARPVAGETDHDLIQSCPLVSRELQREIVAKGAAPGVCAMVCKGCGCKGGPGYRGPDGKCVGFANIVQVCGPPPHDNCRRECALVRPGCVGRNWLKAFAATVGLAVSFMEAEPEAAQAGR